MKMRSVYFIKPTGLIGPVKIGCSQSPQKRREALETWAPFALEIVAEIEGDFGIEHRFHSLFADSHIRREWFNWTPELGNAILAIAAGTFDLATLPEAKRIPRIYLKGKTGVPKGTKWSDERKANAKLHREEKKAEKVSGLVRDYPLVSIYDFIADPFKHGVTREEADRRRDERWANHRQRWNIHPAEQAAA